jgi:hypothetical protein
MARLERLKARGLPDAFIVPPRAGQALFCQLTCPVTGAEEHQPDLRAEEGQRIGDDRERG